jgi:hypothetical protein
MMGDGKWRLRWCDDGAKIGVHIGAKNTLFISLASANFDSADLSLTAVCGPLSLEIKIFGVFGKFSYVCGAFNHSISIKK